MIDVDEWEEEYFEALEKKIPEEELQNIRMECDDELMDAIPAMHVMKMMRPSYLTIVNEEMLK